MEQGTERIIETRLRQFREDNPSPEEPVSWQVRRLLGYIHEHLFDPGLSVRTLKARCELRDNNISSRFKNEVGVPIKVYIERLRLDAARVLLEEHPLRVSQIAHAIGYPYLQTFYRVYLRRFRQSPGCGRSDAVYAGRSRAKEERE
jgi:AraC-like DNA-binding protein